MGEKYTHKRFSIISIISLFLVGILLVSAVAYLSQGFREWSTDEWFNSKKTDSDSEAESIVGYDIDGNPLFNGGTYKMNVTKIAFTDIEPTSSSYPTEINHIYLEVEILPVAAANQLVDWSVEWVNPGSEWVQGRTLSHYVYLEPDSDGSQRVKVSNMLAFSEQIKIIVSLRQFNVVKAECVVDYISKIYDFNMVGAKYDEEGVSAGIVSFESDMTIASLYPYNYKNVYYTPYFTDGTVSVDYEYTTSYSGTYEMASKLREASYSDAVHLTDIVNFRNKNHFDISFVYFIMVYTPVQNYMDHMDVFYNNQSTVFSTFTITATNEYHTFSKVYNFYYGELIFSFSLPTSITF